MSASRSLLRLCLREILFPSVGPQAQGKEYQDLEPMAAVSNSKGRQGMFAQAVWFGDGGAPWKWMRIDGTEKVILYDGLVHPFRFKEYTQAEGTTFLLSRIRIVIKHGAVRWQISGQRRRSRSRFGRSRDVGLPGGPVTTNTTGHLTRRILDRFRRSSKRRSCLITAFGRLENGIHEGLL
ncbi:hypothetical protein RSAG8_08795, partial [Rhizoctonia solani AG-8 WAC10335]